MSRTRRNGADIVSNDEKTDAELRREQLTRAPKSDEGDAAPRIEVSKRPDDVTRIDVADTAAVRPGDPGVE